MIKLRETLEKESLMMRQAYCDTLMMLAETDDRICVLDADLVNSSGVGPFFKKYPERSVQCGVSEANMVGVAAGLSVTGKVPFAHTFGIFASRRVCDQIFVSCAYAQLNVRIFGSDAGVSAAFNGGTHMPFEDMGVLRSIPNITMLEITDSVMMADIVAQLADAYGVYYIRSIRKNAVGIYEPGSKFEIGKGNVLKDGSDVTIIASGIMIAESLRAAAMLESDGISARVVDMFTWKPVDDELIARCAAETGAIVTAENHNIVGGLNAAVCQSLCSGKPVPVEAIGVCDLFGEVGPEDYLRKRYNLEPSDIAAAAKRAVERKK